MKTLMRNGMNLFFSMCLIVLLLNTVQAQISFNGPGFTIVDGVGRDPASCSPVPVSGFTSNTSVTSVTLTNAQHTFVGDLQVRLYPPAAPPPPSATGSITITSPPDPFDCDLAGNYRFIDTAATSIDTAGCASGTLQPGDYRTSLYGGGTNPGATTTFSGSTTVSNITPAQANGTWLICVFDFAPGDEGTIGATTLTFTGGATASGATINGRVTTAKGLALSKTLVMISDSAGKSRTVLTDQAGFYLFDEVVAGETYIITVMHRRYEFQPIVKFISEDISGVDFTALSVKQ